MRVVFNCIKFCCIDVIYLVCMLILLFYPGSSFLFYEKLTENNELDVEFLDLGAGVLDMKCHTVSSDQIKPYIYCACSNGLQLVRWEEVFVTLFFSFFLFFVVFCCWLFNMLYD